jgi:integrase
VIVFGSVRSRGKRQDGSVRWQARYWHPDDPSKRIEKTFRIKRDAENWLVQQRAEILKGTHVDPRRSDRPFSELVDGWRNSWIDLEPKTRAGYIAVLERHLLPEFGSRRVSGLTTEVVQAYVKRLADSGLSPGTVRSIYSVLRNALNSGVRMKMIAVNPCLGVRLPRAKRQEMLCLTATEVRAVAEQIDPQYRVLVYLAAYTGLRAGELHGLRRRDVDPLRRVITVRQALKEINSKHLDAGDKGLVFGPTKTHEQRSIKLPKAINELLGEHLRSDASGGTGPDDLVFVTPTGQPIRHGIFYRRHFKPAVRRGLPPEKHGLRFHDLRHTCASLLIESGAHPKAIQEQLGHSSIQITMDRYGHLLPGIADALADKLDIAFARSEETVIELAAARSAYALQ